MANLNPRQYRQLADFLASPRRRLLNLTIRLDRMRFDCNDPFYAAVRNALDALQQVQSTAQLRGSDSLLDQQHTGTTPDHPSIAKRTRSQTRALRGE